MLLRNADLIQDPPKSIPLPLYYTHQPLASPTTPSSSFHLTNFSFIITAPPSLRPYIEHLVGMAFLIKFLASIFLGFTIISAQSPSPHHTPTNYVKEACSVTRYQAICVRSLAPFSTTARRSPSRWARAGVSVTIRDAKDGKEFLDGMRRLGMFRRGRNRIALSDCSECFQDAIDNLHRSLGVLRKLDARKFDSQIGDLTTWLSAALTDEDTCLDGFEGQNEKLIQVVRNRVLRASYITSNALALVNKLAATGIQGPSTEP